MATAEDRVGPPPGDVAAILEGHRAWLEALEETPARAREIGLGGRDLERLDLGGRALRWAVLRGADLRGARLAGADLANADLTGADLRGADLAGADLSGADLRGADLEGAGLSEATLKGCDLSGAELGDADLRGVDLAEARGLAAGRLGGADLTGATLPGAIAGFDTLGAVAEVSRHVLSLLKILLVLVAYAAVTMASTRDDKLMNTFAPASMKVPIVDVEMPFFYFNFIIPAFLLILYAYFLSYLKVLWGHQAALPAYFPDGSSLPAKAYPLLLNGIAAYHLPRLAVAGGRTLADAAQRGIAYFLTLWLVPLAMGSVWLRCLSAHSWEITAIQIVLFAASVFAAQWSYAIALTTFTCRAPGARAGTGPCGTSGAVGSGGRAIAPASLWLAHSWALGAVPAALTLGWIRLAPDAWEMTRDHSGPLLAAVLLLALALFPLRRPVARALGEETAGERALAGTRLALAFAVAVVAACALALLARGIAGDWAYLRGPLALIVAGMAAASALAFLVAWRARGDGRGPLPRGAAGAGRGRFRVGWEAIARSPVFFTTTAVYLTLACLVFSDGAFIGVNPETEMTIYGPDYEHYRTAIASQHADRPARNLVPGCFRWFNRLTQFSRYPFADFEDLEVSTKPAGWKDGKEDGSESPIDQVKGAELLSADLRFCVAYRAFLVNAKLWNAELREADLRRADLRGADLRAANLASAAMGGADLRDCSLYGANLRGAYLGAANLSRAALAPYKPWKVTLIDFRRNSELKQALSRGPRMDPKRAYYLLQGALRAKLDDEVREDIVGGARGERFRRILLESALRTDLRGADLGGASLREADLRGADLSRALLRGADLRGANLGPHAPEEGDLSEGDLPTLLAGADLNDARLEGADLGGADLKGANLDGARLEGASLHGAHLEGASLRGAHLEGASLRGAHLEGASFRKASLKGASLSGASLKGASLDEASLEDTELGRADLSGVLGVPARFRPTFTDGPPARLPEGLRKLLPEPLRSRPGGPP